MSCYFDSKWNSSESRDRKSFSQDCGNASLKTGSLCNKRVRVERNRTARKMGREQFGPREKWSKSKAVRKKLFRAAPFRSVRTGTLAMRARKLAINQTKQTEIIMRPQFTLSFTVNAVREMHWGARPNLAKFLWESCVRCSQFKNTEAQWWLLLGIQF